VKLYFPLNQRLLFVLIRGTLGVILLSDISITTTYPEVYQSAVLRAGLGPLNATLTTLPGFSSDSTSEFSWYYPAILTNTAIVTTIAPQTCSGNACQSYFLPGSISIIEYDPTLPEIGKENYTEANGLIVNDAPGYQIEYSKIDGELVLDEGDCRLYGVPSAALQICVRQNGTALIGGIVPRSSGANISPEFVSTSGSKPIFVLRLYRLAVGYSPNQPSLHNTETGHDGI